VRALDAIAVTALAVAAAAVSAGCGSGGVTPTGTGATPTTTHGRTSSRGTVTRLREVNAAWRLGAVKAHGRVLALRYDASGCLRGDGRAVVSESKQRVVIKVREHEYVPGPPVNGVVQTCVNVQHFPILRVRLAAPLAGRPVLGGPRLR
jgi:hypothetical protein